MRLKKSTSAASHFIHRLVDAQLISPLRRGMWMLEEDIPAFSIPEYLIRPYPAYLSLQTALYLHGMISQIPQIIYVVSLAPTQRIKTTCGTFSVHHMDASFFGGYQTNGTKNIKLATPEKALLDYFYFSNTKSRLFARLPELELPENWDQSLFDFWLKKIPSPAKQTLVQNQWQKLGAELALY